MHTYRITLKEINIPSESCAVGHDLEFEVESHDDILGVLEKMRRKDVFGDDAPALAVGLKLVAAVMARHKELPLVAEFKPHFGAFMKELKKL